MNTLATHIEYLLTIHDCVIIPDFGGFVLRYQEAMTNSEGKLMPPRKIVGFNPILTYNDGLLANSYMQEKKIPFQEAMILIQAEVRQFQASLQQGNWVDFGEMGSFHLSNEGQLEFMPSPEHLFDLDLFGLSPLQLMTLQPFVKEENSETIEMIHPSNPDVVLVPVNVRLLRHVSVVAAMIIGLLFVSHPLEQGNVPSNYASLVSSGLIQNSFFPQISQKDLRDASDYCLDSSLWMINEVPALVSEEAEVPMAPYQMSPVDEMTLSALEEMQQLNTEEFESVDENEIDSDQSIQSQSAENVSESNIAHLSEPASEMQNPAKPLKHYYIILGSFNTESQALQHQTLLSKKGITGATLLHRKGKYRIYARRFTDKEEANQYLNQFRAENEAFSDAWLMPLLDQ